MVAEAPRQFVTMRQAARLAGVPQTTMWRRLRALDDKWGGGILVRSEGTNVVLVFIPTLIAIWPELMTAIAHQASIRE